MILMIKDFGSAVASTTTVMIVTFMEQSIHAMMPWLIVMFAVILCDFIAGIRKSLILKLEVRWSSAFRRTMGKMVTYFSFVMMIVLVNNASQDDWHLDKWMCLLVCLLEVISIFGNILKAKGLQLDTKAVLTLFFSKMLRVSREEVKDIVKETDEKDNDIK